jgi:hypothetical protein
MNQKLLRHCISVPIAVLIAALGMSTTVHAGDWWEEVKVKGDLRYRHEMIDKQDKDARHRHRVRARVSIYGTVSPYTKVGVRLATGSDDPVSTNQTLDDAFSTKLIGVDLAYFETKHDKLPGVKLTGGKFKNPFFKPGKSELIWDSDWNPEGGVIDFKHDVDNVSLNLIGGGLWVDERSSDDDSYMIAGQGLARISLDEKKPSIAAGAGFFNYVNTMGFKVFYNPENAKGNSAAYDTTSAEPDLYYTNDYEVLEFFAEVTHKSGQLGVSVYLPRSGKGCGGRYIHRLRFPGWRYRRPGP